MMGSRHFNTTLPLALSIPDHVSFSYRLLLSIFNHLNFPNDSLYFEQERSCCHWNKAVESWFMRISDCNRLCC